VGELAVTASMLRNRVNANSKKKVGTVLDGVCILDMSPYLYCNLQLSTQSLLRS